MAKILAGTVEVAPKCALPWQALLSYVRSDQLIEGLLSERIFLASETIFESVVVNILGMEATKMEEYGHVLETFKQGDPSEATKALETFRARVVPELIKGVVGCECER